MVKQKFYTIIWDRKALNQFIEILTFLSKQSSQAPKIVKEGVLSRLKVVKTNPLIFAIDKLKGNPHKEFRAFVIYSYRITYQIKAILKKFELLGFDTQAENLLGINFIRGLKLTTFAVTHNITHVYTIILPTKRQKHPH